MRADNTAAAAPRARRRGATPLAAGVLALLLVPWVGCDDGRSASPPPADKPMRTVQMRIGDKTFTLEVAETDQTRKYGLMNRSSMPADRGMLFVFEDEDVRGFWNHNVFFPLDIIFLDSGGQVVSIRQMAAKDESPINSGPPMRYAVELNQGMAAELGVDVGDVLEVPPEARRPRR